MSPVCSAANPAHGIFSPRMQAAGLTCACGAASAFLYAIDPNRHAVYPQCLFYRTTGLYCAGCGATRALYALLHGQFLRAVHDNALFVAGLPFLLAVWIACLVQTWRANAWPVWSMRPRSILAAGAAIFAVLVLFTVLRNLPGPSFAWLRPA